MTESGIDRRHLLKLIGAGGAALVGVGGVEGGVSRASPRSPRRGRRGRDRHVASCVLSRRRPRGRTSSTRSSNRADIRVDPTDGSVQTGTRWQ